MTPIEEQKLDLRAGLALRGVWNSGAACHADTELVDEACAGTTNGHGEDCRLVYSNQGGSLSVRVV